MRITVKQLKQLIREAVEETMAEESIESKKKDLIQKWKGSGHKHGMSEQEFARQLYYMATHDEKSIHREGLAGVREKYYQGWSDEDLLDVVSALDPKLKKESPIKDIMAKLRRGESLTQEEIKTLEHDLETVDY